MRKEFCPTIFHYKEFFSFGKESFYKLCHFTFQIILCFIWTVCIYKICYIDYLSLVICICHLSFVFVTCHLLFVCHLYLSPVICICHLSFVFVTCHLYLLPVTCICHLSLVFVTCHLYLSPVPSHMSPDKCYVTNNVVICHLSL